MDTIGQVSTHHTATGSRAHTALRVAACTVVGVIGAFVTLGCLLTLLLANLSFFGERPHVPVTHTVVLLTGAAAGIGVPALVAAFLLNTWRQRLVVASVILTALLLGVLSAFGLLAA
jgi:hypothetical protein